MKNTYHTRYTAVPRHGYCFCTYYQVPGINNNEYLVPGINSVIARLYPRASVLRRIGYRALPRILQAVCTLGGDFVFFCAPTAKLYMRVLPGVYVIDDVIGAVSLESCVGTMHSGSSSGVAMLKATQIEWPYHPRPRRVLDTARRGKGASAYLLDATSYI